MCGILKFNIGIALKAFSFLIFVNFVFVSNLGHKNTFYILVHKVKSWSNIEAIVRQKLRI